MSGKNHIELVADLTAKASMDNLVEQLPDLDGIVHCAGVNHRIVTKLIEPADIEQTISPNLVAPILLQTALLKAKKIKKKRLLSSSLLLVQLMHPVSGMLYTVPQKER